MTTKRSGLQSPDGSIYATLTNGNGTLSTTPTSTQASTPKQVPGLIAPDGSRYMTLTNGNGTLI